MCIEYCIVIVVHVFFHIFKKKYQKYIFQYYRLNRKGNEENYIEGKCVSVFVCVCVIERVCCCKLTNVFFSL